MGTGVTVLPRDWGWRSLKRSASFGAMVFSCCSLRQCVKARRKEEFCPLGSMGAEI